MKIVYVLYCNGAEVGRFQYPEDADLEIARLYDEDITCDLRLSEEVG